MQTVKKKTKGPQTPSGDNGRIHGVRAPPMDCKHFLAGKNDAKELWEIFFLPRVMPSCPFPRTRPAARASLARVLYPEPRTLFAAHITLKHEIGPLKP